MVERETFRRDLYHRISTFPVHVPSLAERSEDIPLLADSFLRRVAGERHLRLHPNALSALRSRSYSGNIRELRNLIERASILADGDEILPAQLGTETETATAPSARRPPGIDAFVVEEPVALYELEQRYLKWMENKFDGDRKTLAAKLNVGTRTLYRKLKAAQR